MWPTVAETSPRGPNEAVPAADSDLLKPVSHPFLREEGEDDVIKGLILVLGISPPPPRPPGATYGPLIDSQQPA